MSAIIREIDDAVLSADYQSNWFNSKYEENSDKAIVSDSSQPAKFSIQIGLKDLDGVPDANSKIIVKSTNNGHMESIDLEIPITAGEDGDNDAHKVIIEAGRACKVIVEKGSLNGYKLGIDYAVTL